MKMKHDKLPPDPSRRRFLKQSGSAVIGTSIGLGAVNPANAKQPRRKNILFILTDQERRFRPGELPAGLELPGHRKLVTNGIVFDNHQIASCVCTPSRSVIYTGQHIQNTGMFDNTNFPWSTDLSTDIPTLGDLLRREGYYSAYKGKWHLTDAFETANDLHMPERLLGKEMEEYGFADYFGIGDVIGHTEGGYLHDGVIAAMTKSWLRGKASQLDAEQTPWFLAVNLVNPHDIMYYNTDLPGDPEVQTANALMHMNREPNVPQFRRSWDYRLPESRNQDLSEPGRPEAHLHFADSRSALVGRVPNEDERWMRLNNYYFNCLQCVDRHVFNILEELEHLGVADDTIVIYTADHGELGGAHGLSGKGATAYREQNNVPFIVSNPSLKGNRHCKAVTSHLDIAPTLVSLAGGDPDRNSELRGKDLSALFDNPEAAQHDSARTGSLFNYNMLAFIDREFLLNISRFIKEGGNPKDIPEQGWRPNLEKRGAMRSVYDGRYKMTRYFAPMEHHVPRSIEALYAHNDLELFDLQSDPNELDNLALDRNGHGDLVLAMNDKLNALIEAEVGDDSGDMLPGSDDGKWTLDSDITKMRL